MKKKDKRTETKRRQAIYQIQSSKHCFIPMLNVLSKQTDKLNENVHKEIETIKNKVRNEEYITWNQQQIR